MESKYIVITGGLGFIGSNLVAQLEKEGYTNIIIADVFGCDDKWKNIAKRSCDIDIIHPDTLFITLDAISANLLSVVHLGAISSTTETNVDHLHEINYKLSVNIFEWCRSHSIQFIYASSASVYGVHNIFEDSDNPLDIRELLPLNAYGWSKKNVDYYIANKGGFSNPESKTVALRFFNVYGPNEYHKGSQSSVVYHFFNQIEQTGKVSLFKSTIEKIENGEQKRDFVYVADCTTLICWLIKNQHISGIFNVGTGQAKSFNEVAVTIFGELHKAINIEYIEMPKLIQKHYQNFTEANIKKLKVNGYPYSFRSLEEGIKDYINILALQDQYI